MKIQLVPGDKLYDISSLIPGDLCTPIEYIYNLTSNYRGLFYFKLAESTELSGHTDPEDPETEGEWIEILGEPGNYYYEYGI